MRDNSMDDTPRIVGFGALTVNQIENVGGMKTGYSTSVLPTLYRSTESPQIMEDVNIRSDNDQKEQLDLILNHEETPCKKDFMMLNTINQSNRNMKKKANIYMDSNIRLLHYVYIYMDDDDRNLRYYKLGKSAQNIFKDHQFNLQRELSPIKFRESSFEKKVLN